MKKLTVGLALALGAAALLVLPGCQEGNESSAGDASKYQKPANTPSPADYAKGAGKTVTPPPPEDTTSTDKAE